MSTVKETVDTFLNAINRLDITAKLSDGLLQGCLDAEKFLRHLFATSPNSLQLADPYVGLIDIFAVFDSCENSGPGFVNRLRARTVEDFASPSFFLHAHRLFPIGRPPGSEALVPDLATFLENWHNFTYGLLDKLEWTNVIAAGGSVQACMLPLPPGIGEDPATSKREINSYYQKTFPWSDIDLFIWGTAGDRWKALFIIATICINIEENCEWEIVYVRKANTISIHTLFPYRPIQIVLRLYNSPAEILAGFDIDAACFAFDVWTNPRGLAACIRRCNTVDMTRRSSSYETRLAKYARRGFEVYLPSLQRERVNEPLVYNRSLVRFPNGLARLLVLEKMSQDQQFYNFLPRKSRGLGVPWVEGSGRVPQEEHQLDENNYDLVWTRVPYGKAWDAPAITGLIQKIDRKMNDPEHLAEDGQGLHRHAIVANKSVFELLNGTFCNTCSETSSSNILDTNKYIFGPVEFISVNPGRQLISGSFDPIDIDGWCDNAYQQGGNVGNSWSHLMAMVTASPPE